MKVNDWLTQATQNLSRAGIGTARLDALVLLENALGQDRTHLLAHPETEIPKDIVNVLTKQLTQRVRHEPLAFVLGKTEFYGREFIITPAVLEPRPESETMIELLLKRSDLPRKAAIADVGAGSGALGITAKLELPEASVDLLEVDKKALAVAKMNVINSATSISTILSDLLANSPANYDILLCNLPYVPDDHTINAAAMHEPKIAIFGGPDGLDLHRKLFEQVAVLRNKPLLILTESLPPQHEALKQIAATYGYRLDEEEDFIQVFKLIL